MKGELDLCNYATKADLKEATGVDTSDFVKKADLANWKFDVDKLRNLPSNLSNSKNKVDKIDVNKLVPVPVDLSKLSDTVKNYVAKEHVYNATIKDIEDKTPDITNLAPNTTLKNEIPSITNLAITGAVNAKINGIKNKILNITWYYLATTTTLTAVENKIPVHNKYITTTEFNNSKKFYCKISTSKFNKQKWYC